MTRTNRTYKIDESVLKRFEKKCNDESLIMTRIVEKLIKKFVSL